MREITQDDINKIETMAGFAFALCKKFTLDNTFNGVNFKDLEEEYNEWIEEIKFNPSGEK